MAAIFNLSFGDGLPKPETTAEGSIVNALIPANVDFKNSRREFDSLSSAISSDFYSQLPINRLT
jgi:hypothetical protein